MTPLLAVNELRKALVVQRNLFGQPNKVVRAVDGVSFSISAGETLGLVGESGSGKSTIARLVLRLIEADGGSIVFEGRDIRQMSKRDMRARRRDMQMVFQDPFSSLDASWTVADIIGEPIDVHLKLPKIERNEQVRDLLELVGLDRAFLTRYPYEFSGGQRQRIAIARALALNPKLVLCDEPVSALDMSTQAAIINLLQDLREKLGIAVLFISHNMAVVRHVSHRIAVLYFGRIVEIGAAEDVFERPQHPYTATLLSAIPVANPIRQRAQRRILPDGDPPSAFDLPQGCKFYSRCAFAMDICRMVDPELVSRRPRSEVACHLHEHGPKLQGKSVNVLGVPQRRNDRTDQAVAAGPA